MAIRAPDGANKTLRSSSSSVAHFNPNKVAIDCCLTCVEIEFSVDCANDLATGERTKAPTVNGCSAGLSHCSSSGV